MNFKRIMLIFLVAFALLDVFLFVMVVVNVRFTNIGRQMSQSDIVMKEMRNESISFNGNLAKDNHSGYYYSLSKTNDTNSLESQTSRLHGQSTRIENGILSSSFNHPIKVDMVTKTNDFSRIIDNPKRVLHGRKYHYNADLSSKHYVVYTEQLGGRPLMGEDGRITFRINQHGQVVGYTQSYLKTGKILRPWKKTISQQEAVIELYKHNELPNNSKIHWADLCYTRLLTTRNRSVYVPTWMVEVRAKNSNKEERLKVNALTGTVIKNNNVTVNVNDLAQQRAAD
ncbi:two-component system regulatory protein YycI [Limosilactobacillus sp.]|uniref:two-component system regulatory protein YycI n=1 Tax=Limosilactobacillus sp. TaxID=2773925 RepID=UPI00345EE322